MKGKMSNFDRAFKVLIQHEGGWSNNPNDYPTKYGITSKSYERGLDVIFITPDVAKVWYEKNYWVPMRLGEVVSSKLSTVIFDLAVNQGQGTVVKRLQRLLKLDDDGVIGKGTLAAINATDPTQTALKLINESALYYLEVVKSNPRKQVFLRGWINRMFLLVGTLFD